MGGCYHGAIFTGAYLCYVCPPLVFLGSFELPEAMQGALWLCKIAGWFRALPGRRSILTFWYISMSKDGKDIWWQRWE